MLLEAGEFLYDADSYADDLPYWVDDPFNDGHHLVVPYTLDANDMRFAAAQGFNSGTQFYDYLKDTFDCLYDEGAEFPKLMSVGLHCRIAGKPGRYESLKRFIDYVRSRDGVWLCRRVDVAKHWYAIHAPE